MKNIVITLLSVLLLSTSLHAMTVKEFKRAEERSLENTLRDKLDSCRLSGQPLKQRQRCVDNAKIWHKKRLLSLNRDPEAYYMKHYQTTHQQDSSGNISPSNPSIIYDKYGRALYRAAGGYTDNYGTFYSDAAGGIVNSRTGQFIPNGQLHQ